MSQDFRVGLIASIIGGLVLVYLLQPAVRLGWSLLLRFGGRAFDNIIDALYKNAALGNRDWVVVLLAFWGLSVTAMAILAFSLLTIIPFSYLHGMGEPLREFGQQHSMLASVMEIVLFIVAECSVLIMAGAIFLDLQLNASFNQRLAVLAAFVPDDTVKRLRAEWAQMQSRKDYLALNSRIEQLASEKAVSLPKTLVR